MVSVGEYDPVTSPIQVEEVLSQVTPARDWSVGPGAGSDGSVSGLLQQKSAVVPVGCESLSTMKQLRHPARR